MARRTRAQLAAIEQRDRDRRASREAKRLIELHLIEQAKRDLSVLPWPHDAIALDARNMGAVTPRQPRVNPAGTLARPGTARTDTLVDVAGNEITRTVRGHIRHTVRAVGSDVRVTHKDGTTATVPADSFRKERATRTPREASQSDATRDAAATYQARLDALGATGNIDG